MPIQAPQWTEFLSCPVCYNIFNETIQRPISLGCGHTVCKSCLSKLHQKKCPFDQSTISRAIEELPVNYALLQLVGAAVPEQDNINISNISENYEYYESARRCIEELAVYLKPLSTGSGQLNSLLSRPMQRKLVTLINCQLVEEEGRSRAMRAARSLGERTVTELILQHQNPTQLSTNLWAAVRARGCQFLGPAMQEEVLKLILLALEDGSALSRKILVLFVVQKLENQYPQASKTAIGHVVQLLYRASCFKVTKRDEESSLMELKEEFRTYEALRREHDSQIVQIATEAGLRIAPEQWSSLLYGDAAHKSHMQSIIDKLQTPQSFGQSVNELVIALQRTGDPSNLSRLRPHLELLANIDPSPDAPPPSWENLEAVMKAMKMVVQRLGEFIQIHSQKKPEPPTLHSAKYKTSLCRDLQQKGNCPRGANCTFAHSQDEVERFRTRNKKLGIKSPAVMSPGSSDILELADTSQNLPPKLMPSEVNEGDLPTVEFIMDNRLERNIPDVRAVDPSVIEVVSKAAMMPPPRQAPTLVTSRIPGPTPASMFPTPAPMFPNGLPYPHVAAPRETYLTAPLTGAPPGTTWPRMTPQELPYIPPTDNLYYCSQSIPSLPPSYHQPYPGMPAEMIPVQYPPGSLGYPPGDPGVPVPVPLPYQAPRMSVFEPPPPQQYAPPETWPTNMPCQYYITPEETYLRSATPYVPPPSTPYADHLNNTIPPDLPETLDDLHQRRKEILVHLNSAPITSPLHVCPSSGLHPRGVPAVSGSGSYVTPVSLAPASRGYTLPSLERPPLSPRSLAKSVTDTYVASRSTSTLARSLPLSTASKEVVSSQVKPEQKYTSWSSGESFTGGSNVATDSWSRLGMAPSNSEEDKEDGNDDDFSLDLSEQISNATMSDDDLEEDGAAQLATSFYQSHQPTRLRETTPITSALSFLEDDFFIPFDPPIVSKYGPISRCAKFKVQSSDPVNVMAEEDCRTLNPVNAVTPLNRPYPISVQAPTRFPMDSGPSPLRPDAKPFTSLMSNMVGLNLGLVPRCSGNSGFQEPYSLWESRSYMRPSSTPTVQDHLKHELARLEHQIHLAENSQRGLSVQERLQCELQAIEHHISMQTGKTPNASLETQGVGRRHSNHVPVSRPEPICMSRVPHPAQVLDANIDLNAALTPEEERELKDLHLALQAQKYESDSLKNQKEQVKNDRRYAERLVLEEARKKGISSTSSDSAVRYTISFTHC